MGADGFQAADLAMQALRQSLRSNRARVFFSRSWFRLCSLVTPLRQITFGNSRAAELSAPASGSENHTTRQAERHSDMNPNARPHRSENRTAIPLRSPSVLVLDGLQAGVVKECVEVRRRRPHHVSYGSREGRQF